MTVREGQSLYEYLICARVSRLRSRRMDGWMDDGKYLYQNIIIIQKLLIFFFFFLRIYR